MSKKLYSAERWKRHLKRRQLYQLERTRKRRKTGYVDVRKARPREKRRFVDLKLPTTFSIVENPEEVLEFLSTLKFYAGRHNVNLDLSEISAISTEAIAALIATIKVIGEQAWIGGNLPIATGAREILVQSGFFSHVRSRDPLPSCTQGRIAQKHAKKVEPVVAQELIRIGTEAVYGKPRRSPAAYRTLIESMNNTHNHAAKPDQAKETWWSTVYGDTQRKRVCYTFVDTGIGIFRSIRVRGLRRAYRLLNIQSDGTILRDMLRGEVESSTGIPHRGKGLPAIYKECQSKRIQSLVIVANGVFANVSRGVYRTLKTEFGGTLLYWET